MGFVYSQKSILSACLEQLFEMRVFVEKFGFYPQLFISYHDVCVPLQWGAADAEIKVPSGENTELKCSPFHAWSRSVYSHTC